MPALSQRREPEPRRTHEGQHDQLLAKMQSLIRNTSDCVEASFKNSPNIQNLETPSLLETWLSKNISLLTVDLGERSLSSLTHLIIPNWTVTNSCCPAFLKHFQRFLT